MTKLTVFYDARCGLCCAVATGSAGSAARPSGLPSGAGDGDDLRVVAERARSGRGDSAWLMVLWALAEYRRGLPALESRAPADGARSSRRCRRIAGRFPAVWASSRSRRRSAEGTRAKNDTRAQNSRSRADAVPRARLHPGDDARDRDARGRRDGPGVLLLRVQGRDRPRVLSARERRSARLLEATHRRTTLAGALDAIIETKFAYFSPNRRFLGALMPHAADPAQPVVAVQRGLEGDSRLRHRAVRARAQGDAHVHAPRSRAAHGEDSVAVPDGDAAVLDLRLVGPQQTADPRSSRPACASSSRCSHSRACRS